MIRRWTMIVAMAALAGCEGGSAPLPSSAMARQSLQTALEAWKAGKPASSLAAGKPGIEAADFEWKAGKVLIAFTVGEEAPGQGVQTLSASLAIKGETRPKDVKYMVMGLDPVRIFREDDYNRAMNMDGAPVPPKTPRR